MTRKLSALLLFASVAAAIPLREGATLDYRVWRGQEKDSCQVRVTVLGSTKTDSGTLWSIGIRDSLLGGDRIYLDTAQLQQTDTSLYWSKPSGLAAWFAVPYDSLKVSPLHANWGNVRWYGMGANATADAGGRDLNGEFFDRYTLPREMWLPDIGWGRIVDLLTGERWALEALDGIPYDWSSTNLGKLSGDLTVGTSWTWRRSWTSNAGYSTVRTSMLTWTLQRQIPDSAGFKGWEVEQRDSIADSLPAFATGIVRIRWSDGAGIVDTNLLSSPANCLYTSWIDSEGQGFDYRGDSSSQSLTGVTWSSSYLDSIEKGIGLVGSSNHSTTRSFGSLGGGSIITTIDDLHLVAINGRPWTTAICNRAIDPTQPEFSKVTLRHAMLDPKASLRILSIDGRAVDLSQANWESELDRRHGLLLLELRTPEGTTIGKLFQP